MSDWIDRSPAETAIAGVGGTRPADPQLAFLEELLDDQAIIAPDVIALGAHTWAIHGTIAVDGEVIMAEYDTEAHAKQVLSRLRYQF